MANTKFITKTIIGEDLYYLKDKQVRDSIGQANGIATLDSSGKVPSSQLPSYVDDVIDAYYYNDAMYEDAEHTIAITPETGKIYVDLHTSESYRWSGTTYIVLSSPYVLPTASANVLGGIKIGENLYIDENGVVSSSMYIPTLQTIPTPSTTTYEKDGKQIPFIIGQFARVVSGDGYEFYQVNDIKNNGTEVVWAAPSYLIPSVYSAPTAKILTYNTQSLELLNRGFTENGVIQYSSDGTNWGNDVPSATNAGDYIVYWKLIGDSTHTSVPKTAISVTIAKADIIATAPTAKSLTYNTLAQNLITEGSASAGTMWYSLNGEDWSTNIHLATNAGNYTVYWKVIADENYNTPPSGNISVSIAKASGSVTTTPSAKSITYTGSAQILANTGSGTGAMYYSLNSSSGFYTNVPTGTNAGNYTVYFYAAESANYNQSSTGNISVTIAKANPSYTAPTAKSLTYNGSAQALVNAGSTNHGTIQYSMNNSSWSTSVPTDTSAGSKTVYWKIIGDSNHNDKSSTNISVTIAKANQSAPSASGATVTYGSTAYASASGGGKLGSIEWSNGSSRSAVGSQNTSARWSGNGNYNASGWSNSVTLTVNKADQSAPTASGSTVDYGSTATATASGGGGQGSIEWSNGNTRTAAGSLTTQARWSGNGNYNASPWSNTVTLTVNNTHNGHTFVDLGLPSGVKWASMNVGASSEQGYGNFYKVGYGSTTYTKSEDCYTAIDNGVIPVNVDTARQVWGGSWRMPTHAEIDELVANTTVSRVYIGGVSCTKFTASNGNYIILPHSGFYVYTQNEPMDEGEAAYILSGEVYRGEYYPYFMTYCLMGYRDTVYSTSNYRYSGCNVRPVFG